MRPRNWRSPSIIALAGASIAFGVLTAGSNAQAPGAGASARDSQNLVRIGSREIDPLTDRPQLDPTPGSGEALAIIQFVGPIQESWYVALERSGVRIVTYQAQNAYLVHGTGDQLGRAIRIDGVRAAFAYTAADKLDGTSGGAVSVATLSGGDGADARGDVGAADPNAGDVSTVRGLTSGEAQLSGGEARSIAADPGVVAIEPAPEPVLHDESAAQIVAGNIDGSFQPSLGSGYLAFNDANGFSASNLSDFVVDISDSGLDKGVLPPAAGSHPDFNVSGNPAGPTRIAYTQEATADANNADCVGHGTHVASDAVGFNDGTGASVEDGAGFNYGVGTAPRARVGSTKVFNCAGDFEITSSEPELVSNAYAQGARVSNNSWGAGTNGRYNSRARAYDALVRDAQPAVPGNQQMVEIFSAGNSGEPGLDPGETADGYKTIGSPGVAKNVITVGASEGVRSTPGGCRPDSAADSARDVAPFSSRGPTDDGRQKPDIVAPGTHVTAALSGGLSTGGGFCRIVPTAPGYAEANGTSMAAPEVTGAAALIRDWYRRTRGSGTTTPSPAMTKALLVNSATDLAGGLEGLGANVNPSAPAPSQGWGRANLGTLFDAATVRSLQDQADILGSTGEATTRSYTIANAGQPVRITLAFTDVPGPVTGNAWVNDLDLTVTQGNGSFKGNVLTNGVSTAGGSADIRNNVEAVVLPASNVPFTVTVTGTNIAGDGVPGNGDATDQDYALVVTNAAAAAESGLVPDGGPVATDAGDGDGIVEPGERVRIAQPLKNDGDATAPEVSATLSGPLPALTASTAYPALAAGATGTPGTPLEARVPSTTSCGAVITPTVTVGTTPRPLVQAAPISIGGKGAPATSSGAHNPALAIPDGPNGAEVSSTIALPDSAGRIGDIDVRIDDLTHPFIGDLVLTLTSPGGQSVVLTNSPGTSSGGGSTNNNLTGVTFDDDAATAIEEQPSSNVNVNPIHYRPDQPLSTLGGVAAGGTWTLKIRDIGAGDLGSLGGWSLITRSAECSNPAGATTNGVSSVTQSSAQLNGRLSPGAVPTQYRFEFGRTTAYGSVTDIADVGDEREAFDVAGGIGGLVPGTEYHYRLLALRDGQVVAQGADAAFTTVASPIVPSGPAGPTPVTLVSISFSGTPKTITATSTRKFVFKFTGTASKSGTTKFTTKVKRKNKTLGSPKFKLDSKGKASVKITLSKANFKALQKAKKQTVTATITVDGRNFKRNFTLKPPKKKKK